MSIARYLSKLGALLNSNGQVLTAGVADANITNTKLAANSVSLDKMARVGTAGQFLTSGGAGADPTFTTMTNSYIGQNYQLFVGSGSFTVPAGISSLKISVVSGGGGTSGSYGGTGGFGGFSQGVYTVTPGAVHTVTVGGGGASVTAGTPGSGGTSSFGSLISVTGGAGRTSGSAKPLCGSGTNGTIVNLKQSISAPFSLPIFSGTFYRYGTWSTSSLPGIAWSPTLQGKTSETSAQDTLSLAPGAAGATHTEGCSSFFNGGVGGVVLVEW
jgi:hypothetical protein